MWGSSMKSMNSLALILSTSFLGRAARPGLPVPASAVRVASSPSLRCLLSFRSLPFLQMRASPAPLAPLPSVVALHLQGSDKPSASVTLLALACILAVTLAFSYYSCPCARGSGPDQLPIHCLICLCLNLSCTIFPHLPCYASCPCHAFCF